METKDYFIYIMSNARRTVLYTGVTSDLAGRVWDHRNGSMKGFTKRYNCNKLVYYEHYSDPTTAINREKQIKAGSRKRKEELIRSMNSDWNDLWEEVRER